MANVFELESNASQDANYREHLNGNWLNGNTEFDKLENWLNALEQTISNYQQQIDALNEEINNLQSDLGSLKDRHDADMKLINGRCDKLEQLHRDDVKKLTASIDKLNKAVFGIQSAEINFPPIPDNFNKPLQEINSDDRKDNSEW